MTFYTYVTDAIESHRICEELCNERLIALDTETTGLHTYEGAVVRLLQIGTPSHVYVFDVWSISKAGGLRSIQELLTPKSGRTIIIHNAAFDGPMLLASGLLVRGASLSAREDTIFDTMLASQLLSAGHPMNRTKGYHSLAGLAKRLLNQDISKEQQASDWGAEVLEEEQIRYAAEDVRILFSLHSHMVQKLREARLTRVHWVESAAALTFGALNNTGIPVDKGELDQLLVEKQLMAEAALVDLANYVDQHGHTLPRDPNGGFNFRQKPGGRGPNRVPAGWNPRSGKQMMEAFKACGVPVPTDPDSKKETLDQRLLAEIRNQYELVDLYLRYKTAVTRVSCCETLLKNYNSSTGRIHSSYWQMGADSGRVTSSGPNMQQVPHTADFRGCFRPVPGWKFIVCDYSQVELRIGAAFAREKRMIEAYKNNEDIHKLTGSLVNKLALDEVTKEMRSKSKPVNFGLIYGCGPAALREQAIAGYGVDMSIEEATSTRQGFFAAYSGIASWHSMLKSAIDDDRLSGKAVSYLYTALGRRRMVLRKDDRLTIRANTPVQGTGADMIKLAMAYLWRHIVEGECEIVAMVHDELVIHVPEEKAEWWRDTLSAYMEHAGNTVLRACAKLAEVPIVAEAGVCDSWAEK